MTNYSIPNSGATIGGTIANTQVAVGSATNTIAGSASLTFDGTTFALTGNEIISGLLSIGTAITPTATLDILQANNASGVAGALLITGGTLATQTASTEVKSAYFNFGQTITHATGALTTNRTMILLPPTHAFVGASTLSFAISNYIGGGPLAGSNATVTFSVGQEIDTWLSNSSSALGQFIVPPGIANGVGNTTFLFGTGYVNTAGTIELGDQTATTDTLTSIYCGSLSYHSTTNIRTITNAAAIIAGAPTSTGNITFTNGPYAFWATSGASRFDGRILEKTAAITAANDQTLGAANLNIVSGNTQINAILTLGWTAGSRVVLIFSGTPTVKHNTAGGAGTAVILLAGSADLVAAANTVLGLVYDGTSWQETFRKVA